MWDQCFAEEILPLIEGKYHRIRVNKGNYYYHPTVFIHSISEYIELIEDISYTKRWSPYMGTILYRGMSKQS